MKTTTRERNYSEMEQALYVALELGSRYWRLAMAPGLGQASRQVTVEAGDAEGFKREVDQGKKRFGLPSDAGVCSCYEAGRDAHWVHRFLQQMGIENVEVDSASIEVNRRARRAKSDGLDADSLLRLLMRHRMGERGVWSVVRVPGRDEEDKRHEHRHVKSLRKESMRLVNQVRGLLATQGIRLKGDLRDLASRLKRMLSGDGRPLGPCLKRRLEGIARLWAAVQEQIAQWQSSRREQLKEAGSESLRSIKRMMSLKGIGLETSWTLEHEIFSWRKIRNGRELGSLLGLTPSPYQSGAGWREQGISKSGNRWVRSLAVEVAWAWVRYQPESELTQWFMYRFAEGGRRARKVGIVAVARRLMILLWRFRQSGELPPGVVLKGQLAPAPAES